MILSKDKNHGRGSSKIGCRLICQNYHAKTGGPQPRYSESRVKCIKCDLFISIDGVHSGYCRCCGNKVRTRPRNTTMKRREEVARY
jgi:hypothetical protein